MPKDPRKNIDRYKIDGGQLNEFEFQQSQEELAAREPQAEANLIPGTPPEATGSAKAKRATKLTKTAKGRKSTRATKSTKGTKAASSIKATKGAGGTKKKAVPPRGASAKKLAARKAAKK